METALKIIDWEEKFNEELDLMLGGYQSSGTYWNEPRQALKISGAYMVAYMDTLDEFNRKMYQHDFPFISKEYIMTNVNETAADHAYTAAELYFRFSDDFREERIRCGSDEEKQDEVMENILSNIYEQEYSYSYNDDPMPEVYSKVGAAYIDDDYSENNIFAYVNDAQNVFFDSLSYYDGQMTQYVECFINYRREPVDRIKIGS